MSKKEVIFFVLLVLITFFLRFYRLTEVPPSLYQDETAIGYNAYLIAEKGIDEYGKHIPLYFKSFGDYKLPVYIYTTALFIKIFGLTEFAVRAPSAFAGSFSVLLLFILVYQLSKNRILSFIAAFLLTINPWHLQFSRAGFEVNLALFFTLLGTVLFIEGVQRRKYLLLASLLSFVLSLYSYNVTRLLVPFFLSGLIWLYIPQIKKINKQYRIILIIIGAAMLMPFLLSLLNNSEISATQSNLITSTDIAAKNVELRSYLSGLPGWFTKIFYNNYLYVGYQYLQNIALIISGSFFFVEGTPHTNQGIGNFGTFYLFQLPLIIGSLVFIIQNNLKYLKLFLGWTIITVLLLALSKEVPHATRGYFLVIPLTVFSAHGLIFLFEWLYKNNTYLRIALVGIFILFGVYNTQYYFLSYYYRYPSVAANAWRTGEKELSLYLKENLNKYDKIIIENGEGDDFFYTSLLFYTQYSPDNFLDTVKREQVGLLTIATTVGNVEIRPIDWEKDVLLPRTLIITNDPNITNVSSQIKTIYNPTKHIVLSENEKIVQAPLKEIKYVVVEADKIDTATRQKLTQTAL